MPWYFPWSDSIKKRACRYLLQHYLGRFLETKLELDQLSVDLYKGTGCVKNVNLDVDALNEFSEEQGFPIEFLDGSIAEVSVSVPWSALLSENSSVEIKGLCLVIHPRQQTKNAFMWESMINSMNMTTSMQLAEECFKQNEGDLSSDDFSQNSFEGLELFAQTLDTVLARIKVRFIDTVIRLEYVPASSLSGVGTEIRIKKFDYYDLAGLDQLPQGDIKEKSAYATKKFCLEGVTLYADEFASSEKTLSRSCSTDPSLSDDTLDEKCAPNKGKENDDIILCGKLSGRHEVVVRFKQCDTISGPKIELDIQLGSAILFLTPRQLHSFQAIFQVLLQPSVEVNVKTKRTEKPMQAFDYRRIENELQHQIKQSTMAGIQGESLNRKGWSSGHLEDSDDEFHPFESLRPADKANDNFTHKNSPPIGSDQAFGETFNRDQQQRTPRKSFSVSENGWCNSDENWVRNMRFSFKLGSMAAIVLHEDVLSSNSTTGHLDSSSVHQMKSASAHFFSQVGLLSLMGAGAKDLSSAKDKLDAACSKSHLRVIMSPVIVAGNEQNSNAGSSLEITVTVAVAEVVECLLERTAPIANAKFEYCPILSFLPHSEATNVQPNIHVKIVTQQPGRVLQKVRNPLKPENKINVQLSPCEVEVDISIVDRITALFNRPSFLNNPKSRFSQMYQEKQPSVDTVLDNGSYSQTHFTVASQRLNIRLRFPIPDLRPIHDMQRTPWWRRHLRPDILTVELIETLVSTTSATNESVATYQLVCKEAKCLYQENENQEVISFMHVTAQESDSVNMADGAGHYDLPRLTLTMRPAQTNSELEDELDTGSEEEPDVMIMSTGEALLGLTAAQPSPFSKKRRIHKGDNHRDDGSSLDELLVPGNSEEMLEFSGIASKRCLQQMDISLPKVTMVLPSQHFYEVLYNRLATDLCLWEPSAPEFFTRPNASGGNLEMNKPPSYGGLGSAVLQSPIPGMFIMCKSGVVYESDSESDEGESGHFSYMRNREWKSKAPRKDAPSKVCVSLKIGKGFASLFCLLKDSSGLASESHHGEVQCSIEDGTLFSVTAFQGDPQTGYVCFQAARASLSHNGHVMNCYDDDLLAYPNQKLHQPSRVDQVIYPSSSDTMFSNDRSETCSMLSLALKIHLDPRSSIKTFKTAVSVKGGTLRHRFGPSPHSWVNQIADFFDAADYPIAGYRPPTVITELHLNLLSCGIDYRPLYLPGRVFVSVGTLNVSSNIVAQTNASVLRFVVEDAALHISDRVSYGTVNLQRDYVCVMDIDLLELSLRLRSSTAQGASAAGDLKFPEIDLQTTLNLIRLRTCADSCRLLLDLLTYLAEDGDFDEKGVALSEDSSESGTTVKTVGESVQAGSMTSINQEMEAHVNDMMAEAMRESSPPAAQPPKSSSKDESIRSPTEVFFFPNESHNPFPIRDGPGAGSVDEAGGEQQPRGVWHEGVDQLINDALDPACDDIPLPEEEFCILENDPGVGFTPRGGEPQIRPLTGSAIQMVEGHFPPPIGKTDVLKAPKHFPVPVMRYTLREMTLLWEIFGGHDFPKHAAPSHFGNKGKSHRTVTFSKSDTKEKVKFGAAGAGAAADEDSPSHQAHLGTSGRKYPGGSNRQQNVKMEFQMNKVRFQHETYPETTTQASRQVLTVGEIEIRDRLAHSHINKFLYQYCSEARPRQAHANMVLVKALHVRPNVQLPALECCLKVSILPLRLHIDQDTLSFMSDFSAALSENGHNSESGEEEINRVMAPVPVMGVAGEVISPVNGKPEDTASNADGDPSQSPPIYFRSFSFSPDVLIRFDYHGKGVDLSQGPSISGLLVGLGQLNCSQLTLKRLSHRNGLLGVNKLIAFILNEWLMDIKKNQLPSVMAGVGPMHSIIQLVQGIRDLFWLPIEQFQKDGRIVRGLQRGANAFSTSTALAILELTSRLIQTLQSAAETAYDVVSPGPSVKRIRQGSRGRRRRAQPLDIREGVARAYQVVREGFGESAQTLVRVANEEAEQKGMTGAVGGVLRQIPSNVIKPLILATEATVNVIGGVQSQLMPDSRREAIDKWRQDD